MAGQKNIIGNGVKGRKNKSKEIGVPHITSDSFQPGARPIRFLEGRDDIQSDFEVLGAQPIRFLEGRVTSNQICTGSGSGMQR